MHVPQGVDFPIWKGTFEVSNGGGKAMFAYYSFRNTRIYA